MEYSYRDKIDIIIYHFPCGDGFGAAFIAWYYYKYHTDRLNEIEFIPMNYNNISKLETDIYTKIKNKNVLMVDISFKRHIIIKMKTLCNKLIILDHHKSAEKELENIEGAYFDNSKSGIRLSYEYFIINEDGLSEGSYEELNDDLSEFDNFNSETDKIEKYKPNLTKTYNDINEVDIPYLVKYIEDRDLWNWKYQETKPFTFALYNQIEYDFEEYLKIYLNKNNEVENLINIGKQIEKYTDNIINNDIRYVSIEYITINNLQYKVGIINATNFISEIGNAIMNNNDIDFAIVWRYSHIKNEISVSLRSKDNCTDVSEIARIFGGGGHRNASGCSITIYNLGNDINVRTVLETLDIIKPKKSIIMKYYDNIKGVAMGYMNNIWNYI